MIDIVIAAVLLIYAVLGWKRGLIRSLAELAVMIVALLLANQIANAVTPGIVDNYLRPAAHSAIEDRVDALALETGDQALTHETLEGVLDGIPFVGDSIKGLLADRVFSAQDHLLEEGRSLLLNTALEMADTVLDSVVYDLVRSLLCALCFAVLSFLLRLVVKMLNLTFSLPGLKQINELGGLLLGVGKGLLLVCLGVWVLRLTGVITPEMAEGSLLIGAFSTLTAKL